MSKQLAAGDLTLPIKRTEGETLEERLTGNAYHNILPARYLRKDSDGELVEQQEDLFERVARNIALAEAVFEARRRDVEITVTPDQLKPDHPRRDELAAEVFGKGVSADDDVETTLSEYNVNKFAYETVVPELPVEIREHVESTAAEFQEAMERLSFMPNSPTLMNAGDELQQLSACFVDSPRDDIDDIHQTAKEAAQVFQCLTADTDVHVDGDGVVSIADVEPGDKIRQRDGDDHRHITVDETHAYSDAPVHCVETEAGIELTGTPNHELLVGGGWTRIDEIEAGDTLSVRLGWLPDTDETDELATVESGGQWDANRTVSNDAICELHATGLSDYKIAERLDCSPSTVQRRRANELGLDPNGSGGRKRGDVSFDPDEFKRLYETGYSDSEIADRLGVHATTVGQYRQQQSLTVNGEPVKTVEQPTALTPALAELLGMWVGDGSKHQDGIRFHLNREETLEHAEHLCRKLFDEGLDWRWDEGCYEAVLHSHEIKRWWLTNFGDAKPEATSASVPDQIWLADHETAGAFLRGLFSTDGSLQKETYPRLWTASEDLLDDVQQLLLGLGIPALTWELNSADRDYYNVGPTGELGLGRFADLVGFVDARNEDLSTALEETDLCSTSVGTVREKGTWEVPVTSVENAGTATVYDVTVEDDPEYIANSVVSHNSGGGMGYAFWRLRPYGDPVGSTGGIASGPITFMRTYDQLCFPPGTKVLTPEGQQPIETLEVGDAVVDENGDRQPVLETMERHVDEEIVEITPERLNKPIRATAEHPFRVVRDGELEWVDAADIESDDLLVLGCAAEESGLKLDGTVDLSTVASGPLVFTDGGATINREYYGASKGPYPESLDTEVPVADLATVAGWYLAEGCVVYRRGIPNEVTFTLHHDETDAATEIRSALESFDVAVREEPVPDRNTRIVHVESASFAQLIEGLFGTGAAEKRVPSFLWSSSPSVQARVLEALFAGDGTLEKRGQSQRVQLQLANEEIIDFVFQVGLRCGVQFSRHEREPDDRLPVYWVSASVSTAIDTPLECLFDNIPDDFRVTDRTKQVNGREVVGIDSIEEVAYQGPVYNVEVDETHTYVAEDLVVHNCETIAQGGARRGAQMGVMRVSHPDVIQFIHAKNKDVSLANTLRLNDPDDFTHTSFAEALEEARGLIDEEGRVPEHLRNAVEGHLSNFNISVGVTDRFMEAVKNDEEYTFTNPRTEEPHITTEETAELYEMFGLGEHVEVGKELSVPAREIWEHIIEGAHENGEPGVIYLERVNKEHSFDVEEHPDHRILATNPCVTGDTLISTEDGLVSAEELYEQGVARNIVVDGRLSEERVKEASSVYRTGEKEVYELTTEEGYELRLTADHRVMTDDGWVEAGNLDAGDTVHIQNRKGEFGKHGSVEEGHVLGWLVGDGHLKDGEERAVLNFYDEDAQISEQFASDVTDVVREPIGNADYEVGVTDINRGDDYRGAQAVEQHIRSTRLYEVAEEVGLTEEKLQVPDAVMRGSEAMARGFLQALFTADGGVQGNVEKGVSVRLASTNDEFLREVQCLLLNFGIASKVYEDRKESGIKELPDGHGGTKEYGTQGFHELVIVKDNLVRFRNEIGFLLDSKAEALENRLGSYDRGPYGERFEATVQAVEHDGHEAVYDLTEPDTSSFVANGLVVHNCGEQPLEEYEACNLGHINLSTLAAQDAPDWRVWEGEHADEYATQEAAIEAFLSEAIDWEEFDRRIELATRFLENVVTMSDFPVEEIERKVREMRKIGLGIMGLAQLYIQLGTKYGSDTANEIARQLMTHINHHSKWTSHELATKRGSFAEWDNSKYADPTEYREWFEHQTGLDADEWADGFPIRNHNTTTIAPTGCVEENSLVSTDEGLQPIKNLDETTMEFEQWDEIEIGVSTDGGTKTATAVYDNGFADVRRIETGAGFSVASTPDHRFRTLSEEGDYIWKAADEFAPGDRILLQRGTFEGGIRASLDTSESENYHWNSDENLQLPAEMSPELAEFLGYFMGDGYVHEDVGVKLVVESDAEELEAYLRELGETLFGVQPTVEDRDTRRILIFGGRHLPRYFQDNGWEKDDGNGGEGAASAFVPEEVLSGTESIAKAFIRGLFEADGTASRKVELSTVSATLADQVQTLLLSLGCVFVKDWIDTEKMDSHYGNRRRYTVRGVNKREDARFLEEVGFITKSTDFDLTPQSYKNDTYPPAVVETLRALDGYDSVSKPVRKRVNQSPINGSVSRKLVKDVENETGETVQLDGRRLTDFYAATVESIDDDVAYTKDISVPSNNTYIANGFVTHNTTSMVGNTTGGCEPIYNVAYYKNVSDDVQGDEMLVEFDDYFLRVLEANGIDVEEVKEEAKAQMADNEFDGVEGLSTVPDAIGELFVTTGDLSAKQHASIQTACQEGVDSAISKCLEEGTLVQTDSGVRPIESFADEQPEPGEFVDVAEDVTVDGVPVEAQYYAGEKDATRIRVDNGTELVGATESHKVLTPDGWRVLGELEAGDYVVGRHTESHGNGAAELEFTRARPAADGGTTHATGTNPAVYEKDVTLPERMSPQLARFLGMYAADGSAIDERYSVEISTSSERVREEARTLFEDLFGRVPTVEADHRGGDQRDTVYGVALNSKPVWEFVKALCGAGSYEKSVPQEVLQGGPEEKRAFLEGVTLDGYVSGQSLVVYGGMSKELADGVAELLRSFGVPKVYVGRKWVDESDAYSYNVHVTNEAQELVTPIEQHKRVEQFDQRYRVYVPQEQVDKTEFDSRSTEYYAARNFEYRERNHMFNTTAAKLGITDAPPLYEVTDVEDAGTRELYDIELTGPHEYVVGGVVSHNTVNAPNDSTVEDAKEVFEYIYDHGGKGVTYYRDGTRSKQVLTTRAQNAEFADMDDEEAIEFIVEQIEELFGGIEGFLESEEIRERLSADLDEVLATETRRYAEKKPRPDQLHGVTQRIDTGYGKLYVTINEDPETGEPFELFANTGHSGGFTNSFTEALAKTISVALRSGVDPYEIVDKLQGIRSPKVAWDKGEQINSIPDAFGTALRRYLDDEIDTTYPDQATLEETASGTERREQHEARISDPETDGAGPVVSGGKDTATIEADHQSVVDAGENPECPECGSLSLYYAEGCKTCESCGWSEC